MIKSFLQGRFMNHPIHPLLVHFPVALWFGSFVFDIAFIISADAHYAITSWYCMLFGLIVAALAMPAGIADFIEIPRNSVPRRIATTHLLLNGLITLMFIANLLYRYFLHSSVPTLVTSGQFFLNCASIFLLTISAYLGGLLVYNYGIGYKPQLRDKRRDEIRRAA